jgi:pyruvate,water dikinase
MGVRRKNQDPFNAYFYGRPFLNVTMSLEVLDQTPFAATEGMMEQFYAQGRDQEVQIAVPERKFSFGRLWRYCNVVPRALWFALRMPAEIKRAEKVLEEFEEDDRAHPFDRQPDDELVRLQDRDLMRAADVGVVHVSGAGLTGSNFEVLRQVTKNWLDDQDGSLHARLCTGLAALESAQPAYELWDISRLVVASPPLRAAFEAHSGAEIEQRLNALDGSDAGEFHVRLDEFLSRHGHRSVMEAEIAYKSWAEDLPTVYVMVRNYLHAGDSADPRRIEERQRAEREAATADALRRLSWWKRPIFRNRVATAQRWVAYREHTKELFVRAIDRARRLSRELGKRLVRRGLLDDAADLYYLTWEETRALFHGDLGRERAYEQIRRRRSEEERNKRVVLPELFRGRPKPLRPEEIEIPEDRVLRGIAVSPGRITAIARVITDPRVDATIEPGEILVAPVTDAGWTPLFVAAAGVVVDVGGTLSHGSTVAREYGLPAVVNVKHGTRLIRTGQRITVDGTKGEVILEDGSDGRDARQP